MGAEYYNDYNEQKMADLIANYKGKYTDSFCKRFGSHEELIERLLDFPIYIEKPKSESTRQATNQAKVLKK